MAKKQNVFDNVDNDKLIKEAQDIMDFLSGESIQNLSDTIHNRVTNSGGIIPSVTAKIENKIDTQLTVIESCIKVLKSVLDKNGITPFVTFGIETIFYKLKELDVYLNKYPIKDINDRIKIVPYGKQGKTIELLVATKEDQIKFRAKMLEKMQKINTSANEINDLKKQIQVKGGYEIPLRMKIKRN